MKKNGHGRKLDVARKPWGPISAEKDNHVVNGPTRTFAYHFQGRMTSLTDIDGSVFAYEFDGEGNRLSQSLNDCLSKRFVYDGADVLLELNPANGVAYAWVNGPGIDQPVERLLFIDGAPRARRVFHADALGSIAALTDPTGLVTQTYAYSAFGALRSSSGPDPNRVTFTGREQLGDSQEWMYYRNRVYLPVVGRFTSMDPLGFEDSNNLWLYSKNNPILFGDSFGLRIQVVNPGYRAYVLSILKQFVHGNLYFDIEGFLQRAPNGNARREDMECYVDSLIESENVYQIVPEIPEFIYVDGAFVPYSQQAGDCNWWHSMGNGGTIYFSPKPSFHYPSGFLETSPSTPATILAHELMRAVADMKHEPNGPNGSKEREKAHKLAVERANEAYRRMGKPERTSY